MPIIKWGHETKIIDIDWLWKPFIPYSKVTIIEGDGGDGKTTMILTIAAMLSQGIQPPALVRGHLQPSTSCEPVTTFYLTNEDEVADSSLKRFTRAGGDTRRFAYSGELEHHMTINEEELREVINQTQARLIIIDPFSFVEYEEDNDEEPAQTSKTKRAMEILEEMLMDGPVPVSEIHAVMADEGIGDKTAQRARQRLGAVPDNLDGINVWKMPE